MGLPFYPDQIGIPLNDNADTGGGQEEINPEKYGEARRGDSPFGKTIPPS
jgi:hypothetical protein